MAIMKQMLLNSFLVGVGGFTGSLARYACALALQRSSMVLPAGTLAANLGGCFVIGMIAQLALPSPLITPEARLLLATGFCGGFTTMSSMVYETAQMTRDGEYLHAGGYLLLTLFGSFMLFYLGSLLVKMLLKGTGGIWN